MMQTIPQVQDKLSHYLERIEQFDPGDDPHLEQLNAEFLHYLLDVCADNTALLAADIQLPATGDMGIVTSSDGNLRIYWWDTRFGDVMKAYNALAQYKDGTQVKAQVLNNVSLRDNQNYIISYGGYYQYISTVRRANGNPIYLADSIAIVGALYIPETLQAFVIGNSSLSPTKIFTTNSGPSDKIEIEYDQWDALHRKTIHFSEETQQLFIPETNNFMFTGNYGVYTFDGAYFVPADK